MGELVYGLHATESKRVLQRCAMDRGFVLVLKKPWASSCCSVLTLYMSGYVSLDRPPLGGPSGVFLAVKEVGFKGSHMVLGASKPLEATGKLYLLVSRPVRDLILKVAGNAVPKGQHQGAPEPR